MTKRTISGKAATHAKNFFGAVLLTALFAAAGHLSSPAAEAAEASFSWVGPSSLSDGTQSTDLAGYKLYLGNVSGNYYQSVDIGNQTSYTLSDLSEGTTYYFAVTAYDTERTESDFSEEVSKSIPAAPASYVITATAGSGGAFTAVNNSSINQASNGASTVTSVTVNGGANQSFTIAAATDYHILDLAVDGTSVGPLASYSFSSVGANHTIAASFAANAGNAFTVTPAAGANGSIEPATAQAVSTGASTSFTLTPASGYRIASVTGCGGTLTGSVYTTGAISGACSVAADFSAVSVAGDPASRDGIFTAGPGKTAPDLADVQHALMITIGKIEPTAFDLAHGDIAPLDAVGRPAGNGRIDISDVIGLLRMSVGLL
jgi:hypothetical protein